MRDKKLQIKINHQGIIALHWANNEGMLPNYFPLKILLVGEEAVTYSLPENQWIPPEATKLVAVSMPEEVIQTEYLLPYQVGESNKKPLIRFGVMSDTHINGKKQKGRQFAFDDFYGKELDAVLHAGDITNDGTTEEFMLMQELIERSGSDISFLAVSGNHDDMGTKDGKSSFFAWLHEKNLRNGVITTGCENLFSTRIQSIHVIGIEQICEKGDLHVLGEDTLEQLDQILTESDGEYLRIVLCHYPVSQYVCGAKENSKRHYIYENKKLFGILEAHGNILYITGHTHNSFDSDYPSIVLGEHQMVYVNAASFWNAQPCEKERKEFDQYFERKVPSYLKRYLKARTMGLVIEVYEDEIVFKARDCVFRKWIPRGCIRLLGNVLY